MTHDQRLALDIVSDDIDALRIRVGALAVRGVSVRFLARMTALKVAAGLMPADHIMAVEAAKMFANETV